MSYKGISVDARSEWVRQNNDLLGENKHSTEAAEFAGSRSKVKVVEIDAGHQAQLSPPELIARIHPQMGEICLTHRTRPNCSTYEGKKTQSETRPPAPGAARANR